jgi:hypothetical protein
MALRTSLIAVSALLALVSGPAVAVEGKWLPEQVPKLPPEMLKKLGLQLPVERLWDPQTGTGLLSAAVNINGCSAAFISDTGLIITNHHCAFGLIAEHSTPTKNLLEDGFVAPTRADELPGTTSRIWVPTAFTDVTDAVHAAAFGNEAQGIVPASDDVGIFTATDQQKKAIVQACEKTPGKRCDVATFYGGLRHIMMEQVELTDVRLVYAPPRAVGEFGGEVDNWMWPRHSGDFAIVRAYVDAKGPGVLPAEGGVFSAAERATHVPYKPAFHFPLSQTGTVPGDFVMVLGYPGNTVRELLGEEMRSRATKVYPWLIRWSDDVIGILEGKAVVADKAGSIAVAPMLKSQHNRRKNAQGQLEGLARGDIIARKLTSDAVILAAAQKNPRHKDAVVAHAMLLEELRTREEAFEKSALLSTVFSGSRALSMAARIARLASEREKPDLARDENYMERERPRNLKELSRDHKAVFLPADQALFGLFVERALSLPPGKRIKAVDDAFRAAKTTKQQQAIIAGWFKKTRVLNDKTRAPLLTQPLPVLAATAKKDPLLAFAIALNRELDDKKRDDDRAEGASLRLRPVWMQAVIDDAKGLVAPDANRTLRVSFAKVRGYSPKDGLSATPYTSLSGLFAKDTGAEPFAVPERLKLAAAKGVGPPTVAPFLGDVPVNFLADADTTGGNSGSPVVNGRGELVGVNFDRVWENVANDFGYNEAIARNVSVDVRYILWMLRDVDRANGLLTELGLSGASAPK